MQTINDEIDNEDNNNKELNENLINNTKENNIENKNNIKEKKKKIYKILVYIIIIGLLIGFVIFMIIWAIFIRCVIGKNDDCLMCEKYSNKCTACNPGYELFKGKCITYSFKAVYYSDKDNEVLKLIDSSYINKLAKIKINDTFIEPISEYTFKLKGEHQIYFYFMKNVINSLYSMFYNITRLKKILFHPFIDTTNIIEMSCMFSNSSSLELMQKILNI